MTDQERRRAEREHQHQIFKRVTQTKALEVFNKLKSLRVAANDYDFILGPESPLDEEEKLIFKGRLNIHEKHEEVGVYATNPLVGPVIAPTKGGEPSGYRDVYDFEYLLSRIKEGKKTVNPSPLKDHTAEEADRLQKLSFWLFVAAATSAFFNLIITIIKLLE